MRPYLWDTQKYFDDDIYAGYNKIYDGPVLKRPNKNRSFNPVLFMVNWSSALRPVRIGLHK